MPCSKYQQYPKGPLQTFGWQIPWWFRVLYDYAHGYFLDQQDNEGKHPKKHVSFLSQEF
jgi:hypothetical protein